MVVFRGPPRQFPRDPAANHSRRATTQPCSNHIIFLVSRCSRPASVKPTQNDPSGSTSDGSLASTLSRPEPRVDSRVTGDHAVRAQCPKSHKPESTSQHPEKALLNRQLGQLFCMPAGWPSDGTEQCRTLFWCRNRWGRGWQGERRASCFQTLYPIREAPDSHGSLSKGAPQ